MTEVNKTISEETKKKSANPGKIIAIVSGSLVLAAGLSVGGVYGFKCFKYSKASEKLEAGMYDEAKADFTALNDFKDSADYICECDYLKAGDCLAEQDFDEASALYDSLGNYKDSEELSKETSYQKAVYSRDNKIYDEARSIFESLGDYKESSTTEVIECDYQKANDLLSGREYEEALTIFETIPDHKDSADKIDDCKYNIALDHMENNEYEEAADILLALGDYSDSENQLGFCYAAIANELTYEGDYDAACEYFLKLTGFSKWFDSCFSLEVHDDEENAIGNEWVVTDKIERYWAINDSLSPMPIILFVYIDTDDTPDCYMVRIDKEDEVYAWLTFDADGNVIDSQLI